MQIGTSRHFCLFTAYMQIGTTNVSAVLGAYYHAIAMATEKFAIPFYLTTDVQPGYVTPFNLITVFPSSSQLYKVAVDLILKYNWSSVAVIY